MADDLWTGLPVLLTGASGFVGGALLKALIAKGAALTVVLRDDDPDYLGPGTAVIRGDLGDPRIAERAIVESQARVIFHLAALTQVVHAKRMRLAAVESNILGTANLLEAAAAMKGRLGTGSSPAFIFASSDKAYGRVSEPDHFLSESDPFRPRHIYDATKGAADLLAQAYGHQFGLRVGIARMANLYGPGDCNWGRLIPGLFRHCLTTPDAPFVIRSDGKQMREYMHVFDAVSAYLALAREVAEFRVEVDPPMILNFGSGVIESVMSVVQHVGGVVGCNIECRVLDEAGDESPFLALDWGMARATLRWEPRIRLMEGLKLTLPWYREYLEILYGHVL